MERKISENSCNEDKWHIGGNIRRFLRAESVYKDAFISLNPYPSLPFYNEDFFNERNAKNEEEIIRSLSSWLISEIEDGEAYNWFVKSAKNLIGVIEEIVPKDTELRFLMALIDTVKFNMPQKNLISCMCFHSTISTLCEFVHLHRYRPQFQIGWYLVQKAVKHLDLKYKDYVSLANQLIDLVKTDWAQKPIKEVMKLIGNNFKSFPTTFPDWIEENLPLAEVTYGNPNHYREPYDYIIKGETLNLRLIKDFIKDNGRFNLPLSLNGYIATNCYYEPFRCSHYKPSIIVGFKGSSTWENWLTNFCQYFVGVSLVYFMALGLLLEIIEKTREPILVVGHSLGGGLMQFSVAGQKYGQVEGIGYNSAGLSDISYKLLKDRARNNIYHLHLRNDQIFLIGNQLGERFDMDGYELNPYIAHKIERMRYCRKRLDPRKVFLDK